VIAKVIVDISLDREFDYAVPPDLAASVCVGSRVGVPFGHRQTEGYVIALAEGSDVATLKPIAQVIGDHPFIDDTTVKLARWMANYYCARLEQCIRTLLPGAVRKKGDRFKKQRMARLTAREDARPPNIHPTSNAQRPTSNIQGESPRLGVGRWALDVGRCEHLIMPTVPLYSAAAFGKK